jgi:mono/diheme cytochrome c family protein
VPVGRVARGGEIYERVGCYSCHSNQGQGIMHGPRIAPNPIRWGRFVWYIRHPSGQMPPYSPDVLSDRDLADIYAFLRRRTQPQPVESIPLLAP